MDAQRLELLQILYRGLTQLGYGRAHVQHESALLDLIQRAVSEPDFIEALRADTYSTLQDSELSDVEKDTLQFMVT